MSETKASTRLPTIKQKPSAKSATHYITLHCIKQVCAWFPTWLPWQRRLFVCQLMERCSREQLELLATSLEPILHLDFSTSLGPHLQALHLDRAATFHVQRTLVHNVLNPLRSFNSWGCLDSLPTCTMSNESSSAACKPSHSPAPKHLAKEHEVILPALPLTHPHHETSASKSIEDIITFRRQRYGSIPDFNSTANLLRNVSHKDLLLSLPKNHHRSRSLGASNEKNRKTESFKKQLEGLSMWMEDWEASQKAYLLLEVVKMCDQDLLGYFVQCLHQRLHESLGANLLSDGILLKIFSYLTPRDLCRIAQTCKRWNRLSSHPSLWKAQCQLLSIQEGVGDLSTAVEIAFGHPLREDQSLDWKKIYRDLSSVMWKIKELVLKRAKTELRTDSPLGSTGSRLSSAAIRSNLSLKQMLYILQTHSSSSGKSIKELVRSAPESAASARRRQRAERYEAFLEKEKVEMEKQLSLKYHHRKPGDRIIHHSPTPDWKKQYLADHKNEDCATKKDEECATKKDEDCATDKAAKPIPLLDIAVDTRPYVPALPRPEGIECLVLSGALTNCLKPGKIQPIPKVIRLPELFTPVQCLQCDQKKIVVGTANREIIVQDMRSGRLVCTVRGHKGSVQCLQYDQYKIVSGSWDTTCIVWDAVHFQPLVTLRGHTDCVSCLQFNQNYLVTGSHDRSVRVWSTTTWECVTVIGDAHNGRVLCVQLNQWAIVSGGEDKTVQIWAPTTYHHLHSLTHSAPVCSLALANVLLITSSLSGSILLWNVVSGSLLLEMAPMGKVYMSGLSLASERLYGAGSDGVLYEWNICSGTCMRKLTGHSGPLTCVWAGNNKIVTASKDKTVCIWFTKRALKEELTDEESGNHDEKFFVELPIRVVTEK